MEQPPSSWILISVLYSTVPLTSALAVTLQTAAYALYREGGHAQQVGGDVMSGRVRNLRKEYLLGTIGGPAFQADLETARGPATVRFLLTRQGLELMEAAETSKKRPATPRYLN